MAGAGNSADKLAVRGEGELYPDFTAELAALRDGGPTAELVRSILVKHAPNSAYNRRLYARYRAVDLPIYRRRPRFEEDAGAVNNRVNNDFFGEIVDFATGYFAGKPVGYSYATTRESEADTGGAMAVEAAAKALSDFVVRNNMADVDMELTKYAACCGYAARLFYHDEAGDERVMVVPPYEAAILSDTDMAEPTAALRYFPLRDIEGKERWRAEFFSHEPVVRVYEGDTIDTLQELTGAARANLYGICPLQGVLRNGEGMGDAEKVLLAIDAYDKALSDASNESESFANAYMVFENVNMSDEDIQRGQHTGAFRYFNGGQAGGGIRFMTKDINDAFIEHHLDRLEQNIYRFSRTPNLNDKSFSQNASGVALKFKILGLETKCGIFQAKMTSAGGYMFRLLAASWAKRQLDVDPLQCVMDFHRNFPLDLLAEAQAVQGLIGAGVPERVAYAQLSFVDDVDWLMQEKEAEKDGALGLDDVTPEDRAEEGLKDTRQ